MKRTLICTALALSMATLPVISEAGGNDRGNWNNGRGHSSHDGGRGHGNHYRGDRGYYRGYSRSNDVWPYVLGAVALGAVVSASTGPTYYSGTTYYDVQPAPPTTVYYNSRPSYGYVVPERTCTYYSDGSSYCN